MRRALSREEVFVAGADVVMTDSMRYCDVVLPACSHFEFHDLYTAYGQSYLQRAEPVIPPVGESAPNTEIFRRLAARFGFDEPMFRDTDQQLMDAAVDPDDPRLEGHRPSALPLERALLMGTAGGEPVLVCSTVAPGTASGKVELYSKDMDTRHGFGVPRYEPVHEDAALMLITPSSAHRTNATFGGGVQAHGLEVLELHPDDAAARGIDEGDEVRVWNARGEVVLRAQLSAAMQPGVAYSPKGTWLSTSPTGQTVNALLDADLRTDIADGACYNDTFVEIARL
jgi:anaerobic selenocysteine-containing dehydrogenase